MGLTLSMRERDSFYVGDSRFEVSHIYRDKSLVLVDDQGNQFEVLHTQSIEIAPEVMVSASDRAHSQQARIVIEAPRAIEIRRGKRHGRDGHPRADGRGRTTG